MRIQSAFEKLQVNEATEGAQSIVTGSTSVFSNYRYPGPRDSKSANIEVPSQHTNEEHQTLQQLQGR